MDHFFGIPGWYFIVLNAHPQVDIPVYGHIAMVAQDHGSGN